MKIEIRRDVPSQYPDYQSLWVNGVHLGQYISGENRVYLNPEKWAKDQIKKRTKVLDRNIARVIKELDALRDEKERINS